MLHQEAKVAHPNRYNRISMQPRRADTNHESPHHDNMDETIYLDEDSNDSISRTLHPDISQMTEITHDRTKSIVVDVDDHSPLPIQAPTADFLGMF